MSTYIEYSNGDSTTVEEDIQDVVIQLASAAKSGAAATFTETGMARVDVWPTWVRALRPT